MRAHTQWPYCLRKSCNGKKLWCAHERRNGYYFEIVYVYIDTFLLSNTIHICILCFRLSCQPIYGDGCEHVRMWFDIRSISTNEQQSEDSNNNIYILFSTQSCSNTQEIYIMQCHIAWERKRELVVYNPIVAKAIREYYCKQIESINEVVKTMRWIS